MQRPSASPGGAGGALRTPFLVFLGDVRFAKTASGVVDWRRRDCCAQWRLTPDAMDLGLPDVGLEQAAALGARSLLIGAAPIGGRLPAHWAPHLAEAARMGLDLISGLHEPLAAIASIADEAARSGARIHDIRRTEARHPIANGRKRSGKRLLTVGTDCGVGKKYTALAITMEMQKRAIDASFRATGQTGIMISGDGVAIDGVIADFAAGAAEALSPDVGPDSWHIIEGQGSLFHPSYGGVSLALLHGSQPDVIVLCHDPARTHLSGFGTHEIRPLAEHVDTCLRLSAVTNSQVRLGAISLNTKALSWKDARRIACALEAEFSVPCFDPLRFALNDAVDQILEDQGAIEDLVCQTSSAQR